MDDSELEDLYFNTPEFLATLWECHYCQKKFTGHSIRQHLYECHKPGDTVKWKKF